VFEVDLVREGGYASIEKTRTERSLAESMEQGTRKQLARPEGKGSKK